MLSRYLFSFSLSGVSNDTFIALALCGIAVALINSKENQKAKALIVPFDKEEVMSQEHKFPAS